MEKAGFFPIILESTDGIGAE
ncbi:hypothetical protein [Algoriphagus boritolerans]